MLDWVAISYSKGSSWHREWTQVSCISWIGRLILYCIVQLLSWVQLFATSWTAAHQASLSFTNSRSLLSSCPSSWWCHPTISSSVTSPSPPAPSPSQHQGLYQWNNTLPEVAKVLEFQLQHQSFQWTPRTDLLQDELVGSPCSPRDSQSLLQHHSSKGSIFQRSAFFTVQLSHPTWPLDEP